MLCHDRTTDCHSSGINGTGIPEADFILDVSFISGISCDEFTVAYSTYCALEPSLDRYGIDIVLFVNCIPMHNTFACQLHYP